MKSGGCRRRHVRDKTVRKVPGRKSLDFDELATKFVMGLGRVSYLGRNRSLLAGKLEAMRRDGEGKTWGGKKIMDMGE